MKQIKFNKVIHKITKASAVILIAAFISGCGSSDAGETAKSDSPVTEVEKSTESAAVSTKAAESVTETSEVITTTKNENRIITIGIGSSWNNLNPWNSSSGTYGKVVHRKIFDSLGFVDENGAIIGRDAESWEVAEDGLSITLHLREDSYWHDGEQVTAQDWLWTLETVTNPETIASAKSYLNNIEGTDNTGNIENGETLGIEAPDDFTLQISFKEPTNASGFFSDAGWCHVLPKHLLEEEDVTEFLNWSYWTAPIGSGPCIFESENAGQEIILSVNPEYYLGAADFETLIYRVMESSNFITSILAGEIDSFFPGITSDEAAALEGVDGVQISKDEASTTYYFAAINNEKYRKEIRQAINYAIDKQLLVDQLIDGEGYPGGNYTSATSKYAFIQNYTGRDIEKAKELLDEAGWVEGTSIECVAPAGIRQNIAVILQQNLADVGIDLQIVTLDAATMFSGLRDGTYEMGLISNSSNAYPATAKSLINPEGNTFSHVQDYDAINKIKELNSLQDEEEQLKASEELSEVLEEEQNNIILFHQYNFWTTSDRVSGIANPDYDQVWNWSVTK